MINGRQAFDTSSWLLLQLTDAFCQGLSRSPPRCSSGIRDTILGPPTLTSVLLTIVLIVRCACIRCILLCFMLSFLSTVPPSVHETHCSRPNPIASFRQAPQRYDNYPVELMIVRIMRSSARGVHDWFLKTLAPPVGIHPGLHPLQIAHSFSHLGRRPRGRLPS